MSQLKCLGVPLVGSVSCLDVPVRDLFRCPAGLLAGSVSCLGVLMLRSVSFWRGDAEAFEVSSSAGAEFCELFRCAGEGAF